MSRWRLWAVGLFVVVAVPSGAQADCAEYGRVASAQQQENLALSCGFSGLRWHDEAGAHAGYCALAGQAAADAELALREQRLQECRTTAAAEEPAAPGVDCRTSEIAEGMGATSQAARLNAQGKLGRARAEMLQSGLHACLWNDLGCTGPNGSRTCYLSVHCCPE